MLTISTLCIALVVLLQIGGTNLDVTLELGPRVDRYGQFLIRLRSRSERQVPFLGFIACSSACINFTWHFEKMLE